MHSADVPALRTGEPHVITDHHSWLLCWALGMCQARCQVFASDSHKKSMKRHEHSYLTHKEMRLRGEATWPRS